MTELKKKLCGSEFIIDSKNVYIDHILIWFNEYPIFFVCVDDNGQYYLAFMLGFDDDTYNYVYYIAESSTEEIVKLMLKEIPMIDVLLKKEFCWKVTAGVRTDSDVVEKLPIDAVDLEFLPDSKAYFETTSLDDKMYLKKMAKMIEVNKNVY